MVKTDSQSSTTGAERAIEIEGKYLLLPIRIGGVPPFGYLEKATMQVLDVYVGGMLVHSLNIYLAHNAHEIDWWANIDLSEFIGRKARLCIRFPNEAAKAHMPADSKALAMIETSDEMRNLAPLYDEPMCPQFHHSQKRGWNNDTNGMVYYDEEYHLFWQSNPVGKTSTNKYWGHLVSRDLVHWEELRPGREQPRRATKPEASL